MKYYTLMTIILYCLASCRDNKNGLSGDDSNVLIKKYPNTSLVAMKVEIKDELYHGRFEAYYRSGKKKAEGFYKKGLLDGIYQRFREDGSLISKEFYKRNRLDSTSIYYRPDGTVEYIKNFYGGQEHGLFTSYYPNGNTYQEFNYVYTRREGPQKVYYPNKILKWTDTFVNGYSTGNFKSFNEDGSSISLGYSIVVDEINEIKLARRYIYRFKLNKKAKEVEFFAGETVDGKRNYQTIRELKRNGDWFEWVINIPEGNAYIAKAFIIAVFKTNENREASMVKDLTIGLTNF